MENINSFLWELQKEVEFLEKEIKRKQRLDLYWRTEQRILESYKRLLK